MLFDFIRRYKRSILWTISLLMASVLWAAIYLQAHHDRNQAREEAELNVKNYANALEIFVASTVRQIDSTLLVMRDDYAIHPSHLAEQLATYKKDLYNNLIIQVSVIDEHGMMVFNEQAMPKVPLNLSDREHFTVHRDSNKDFLFISKPVIGRVSKKWSIQFTRKIFRQDGGFGGVMVVSVSPEVFSSFFRTFNLGEDSVVTLAGTDRVIRVRTVRRENQPALEGQTLPADRPPFDPRRLAAGLYHIPSGVDSVPRTWAYRRLDNYPLTVVVGLADDQVYGPVNSRRNSSILLGVVVSILLLAGTRLILSFERQQRQVDDDLREANKRLGMAAAAGRLGIWEWDVLTGSLVWDARMLEMYGIKPESFSGHTRDFQKALHPDDLVRTNRALKAAITGEKNFSTIRFRIVHSDGAVKIITANGQVIRDPSGRAVRMIGLNRDITDHMTAVNELRESEQRFKTLADATFEGIAISAQGRYVDVNRRLSQILGFERSELIGREMPATLVPEERTDASGSRCEDCVEHEMVCKDGSRRFVEARSQTVVEKGREFSITAIRDITERKQMEDALRASEDQFRSLCNAAPIGIFKLDRDGNNVYGNPRWEEITGYSASQGMNMGWLMGIHPDDRENVSKMLLEATSAGRGFSHEHRHQAPCGKTVWVRKLVNPVMNSEDTVLSYVGTLEDITELLKVRREMQKVQKLESLGVLAGGIAHDFNNFLTAILGNVSLARSQSGDPERLNRRLEFLENATLRATGLTNQLLTFARGGDPVKRIINVNDLLREAVPFALHGSNVVSDIDLAEDICLVEADEGQLAQVIHNLMINAVQAMPKGGTVTVRSEKTRARDKGEFVRISFADTGTGISEENLGRIFDPYFTTKDHGSGLGLATCYSIIKKHGGKIRVTSAVGKGSAFVISLPASAHVCMSESMSATTLFHGNGRVLVMDDDEDIRDIAREMLEELGYTVELAANAADAVKLYRTRKEQGTPFSATILDLTIQGGIGGKETIEKLLELDSCVKAVVSSGYSNDPIMANYRDWGFQAVLSKPYLPLEMSKVLRELTAL